jgi:hypothetical protein
LQIVKVGLDLIEEPPRACAFRRQEATAMLQASSDAARYGAEDLQVGDQGLGRRGLGSETRPCVVVGDAQHE